jgi:hypothetical protein
MTKQTDSKSVASATQLPTPTRRKPDGAAADVANLMACPCPLPLHVDGVEPGKGPCPLCGRPRCRARAKGSGERCRLSPKPATPCCTKHGSGNARAKAASARRLAEAKAASTLTELLATADAAPVVDPLGELARVAGVLRDAHDHALGQLNAQRAAAGKGSAEAAREALALWERLLALLTKTLASMAALGIEAYQVRIDAEMGKLLVDGMQWLLGELGLEADPAARDAARRMFEAMAKGMRPTSRPALKAIQ